MDTIRVVHINLLALIYRHMFELLYEVDEEFHPAKSEASGYYVKRGKF